MPVPAFRSASGRLSAHVFENPRSGVRRALYWTLRGDFAPMEIDGSEWQSSVRVEWLTFDVRRWPDLSGAELAAVRDRGMLEASVYFTAIHQPADLRSFRLERVAGARFKGSIDVSSELELLDGTTMPQLVIVWSGEIEFEGIQIIPENLFPKPLTPDEATAVVGAFIDPSGFAPPERGDHGWVFRPLDTAV